MKIAVISDIHGNLAALDAVLDDMKAQGCENVFVLGDYAMAGPRPSETVNWFMKKLGDKSFKMIQGNTDLMIADFSDDLYENVKTKAPIMAEALKDDVKTLNIIQKDFLKNLPIQLQIEEEGVKFLLVHGSPRKNNEDILPETPLTEIEKMLENVEADVVLCGHTHLPCGFQTSKKQTVVNVGSVGRPFTPEPKSCYLKLTVENGECMFEHRFVDYNKESASEVLRKRNFKGSDKLADMLLNPTVRHF
ncbi:MAG: metallophosphatase family protein [Candidatus Gastranaerophilales bacterium]|nr:metallophosphatase family protein [Candidatus Gastranaerophilales bacterium]MCM1073720.1 metallophosphatase family protein [Bacteroides sp.]